MKVFILLLLVVCATIGLGAAAHVNLEAKYPFSVVLLDQGGQFYGLHWNFSTSTETIYFAVNVSTTGWVGFGLSPNGLMPASDVVMGWVSEGQGYFWDRYAEGRFLPPIDTLTQDWFLTNSEEEDGFTLLEFSRNLTSCDPQDLDITTSTAIVVWSFSVSDPTDPSGAGAVQHVNQGSQSINLIGGLIGGSPPAEGPFLDVAVTDVSIPSDSTTYWCSTSKLPSVLRDRTHYITRFSPVLTQHPRAYAHHSLVYLCREPLLEGDVGQSGACNQLNDNINLCRQGLLVGAWAVGGEDFVYPEDLSYSIGGTGQEQFVLIEIHYDNPNNDAGVVDNSGIRFYYTTEPSPLLAGIMYLGHGVTPEMVVPPRTGNYTIAGICTAECTSAYIPEEGIRIFANLLHTHLVGRALTIQHFRYNTECNVLEEIEPIDQNLNYDFNYQQFTHLPREHVVKPGDILVLRCDYNTSQEASVTLGGESTTEEMCLSFPVFYPRLADGSSIVNCVSIPGDTAFDTFVEYLASVDPEAAGEIINNPDLDEVVGTLNGLTWAQDPPLLARSLQDSVLESVNFGSCGRENGAQMSSEASVPEAACSYQAPSRCLGADQPLACCDRLTAGTVRLEISVGLGSIMLFLSVLMI